jgi:O-antigen/teichoic acid export membrane protein
MIKKLINQTRGSGNIYSLAGNIVFALFGMVTFLLMVRLLSKELFGQWVLFVTMAAMFDMLRLGLTGTAAIRLISTSGEEDCKKAIGTSYTLGIFSTLIISTIFIVIYFVLRQFAPDSYYLPVFLYYPVLAIFNLPFQQANIVAQGHVDFKKVLILRIVNGGSVLLFVLSYIAFFKITITGLIYAYLLANTVSSVIALVKRWDGWSHIKSSDRETRKQILKFGKYSTASYIGSNLLRSSDTIIMSLIPIFGIKSIAIFSIPLKFIEVVEIPLRSFSATAYPRLSKALTVGKKEFSDMLNQYTFWSTIILVPVVIVLLLFPGFFLNLVGGKVYADSIEIQKAILRLICIYILILPIDRYSGVALFAVDKPEYNFYKIITMLAANIIGDLIALLVFKSIVFVFLATLIFTFGGILIGWMILYKMYGIRMSFQIPVFLKPAVQSA